MLIFRAVSDAELAELASGTRLMGPACAVTPAFLDTFELSSPDDEDAERTALYIAALMGLIQNGRRLVIVADEPIRDTGNDFGVVAVDAIDWAHVSAIFAEDDDSQALADATRLACAQLGVEEAWDHPAHSALLEDADLLWFGPDEWASLVT